MEKASAGLKNIVHLSFKKIQNRFDQRHGWIKKIAEGELADGSDRLFLLENIQTRCPSLATREPPPYAARRKMADELQNCHGNSGAGSRISSLLAVRLPADNSGGVTGRTARRQVKRNQDRRPRPLHFSSVKAIVMNCKTQFTSLQAFHMEDDEEIL